MSSLSSTTQRYFVVGEEDVTRSNTTTDEQLPDFLKSREQLQQPPLNESKPHMYSWRSLSASSTSISVDGKTTVKSAILADKAERDAKKQFTNIISSPLEDNKNVKTNEQHNSSVTTTVHSSSPAFTGTPSLPRQRRPSVKPLESTLDEIMEDTNNANSPTNIGSGTRNPSSSSSATTLPFPPSRRKDFSDIISSGSGSKSIYVSHSPAADAKRVQMERSLIMNSSNGNGNISSSSSSSIAQRHRQSSVLSSSSSEHEAIKKQTEMMVASGHHHQSMRLKRVGVVYSHPTAFSHLESSKGSKSFVVNTPVTIGEMTETATRELLLTNFENEDGNDDIFSRFNNDKNTNTNTSSSLLSFKLRLGFWDTDGVSPRFFRHDYELQRYLHDQPKLVPFCQVFVVDKENEDKLYVAKEDEVLLKMKRHQHSASASMAQNQQSSSRPQSASVTTIPRMKKETERETGEEKEERCDNDPDKFHVVKDENSERGLRVIPPQSNTPGSVRSSWRMNIDATIENSTASNRYVNNNINNSSARPMSAFSVTSTTGSSMMATKSLFSPEPYQPLYSRPQRRLSSCSLLKTATPMPSEFVNFDCSVNEKAVNAVYDRLIMSSSSSNNNTQEQTQNQKVGVRPLDLLDYLDVAFDNLGDRRRFERLIGPRLMVKETLSRDEVVMVLLKLVRE